MHFIYKNINIHLRVLYEIKHVVRPTILSSNKNKDTFYCTLYAKVELRSISR